MCTMLSTPASTPNRFDLLRVPLLGSFLRWRHNRTLLQSIVFLAAAMMIVDGFFGSPLAAKNTATVSAWVHYRGLVVLALLVVGNLFCAACPFVLPRKLAKWLGKPTRRWPKALRNKWPALFCFVGIIYLYELLDLWASPWLTAWLVVAYFATAFVLEALFTRSSFCMYICPLGTFNFLYSTVSPFQIQTRAAQICSTCIGHECINGAHRQDGCQLELYVPTLQSNMDCTLCLDCVKVCPHDNVALAARRPARELFRQSWPHRLDLALLAVIAAFLALTNAFAMTPPVYDLERSLAALLGTRREATVLALVFLVTAVVMPVALVYLAAFLSRLLTRRSLPLNRLVMRHAYSFVPLGFAIWIAHYLFHFLTGAMTIAPAAQTFFVNTLGLALLGEPNWRLAQLFVPNLVAIQTLQTLITYAGLLFAVGLSLRAAGRTQPSRGQAVLEALPWLVVIALLALASGYTFLLPMEMRGSALGG